MSATCASCKAPIQWCVIAESGARMPMDLEEVVELVPKLVALSPRTGKGHVLTQADVNSGEAAKWALQGAQFRTSHWATCATAGEHRVAEGQVALW